MFFLRFACFTIFESPKFLMGKGNDAGAVHVVQEVARRNGKTSSLTLQDLQACNTLAPASTPQPTAAVAVRRRLEKINASHVKSLFATRKLAYSTSLITLIWAFIVRSHPQNLKPQSPTPI